MNKRAFLLTSGTWLGLGTAMASPSADHAHAATHRRTEARPKALTKACPDGVPPQSQADWQALLGQAFEAHTALGQPCTLRLVQVQDAAVACPHLSQFTLRFEGPAHRHLPAGLHWLRHPRSGQSLALALHPLPPGPSRHYLAHFSLLG